MTAAKGVEDKIRRRVMGESGSYAKAGKSTGDCTTMIDLNTREVTKQFDKPMSDDGSKKDEPRQAQGQQQQLM